MSESANYKGEDTNGDTSLDPDYRQQIEKEIDGLVLPRDGNSESTVGLPSPAVNFKPEEMKEPEDEYEAENKIKSLMALKLYWAAKYNPDNFIEVIHQFRLNHGHEPLPVIGTELSPHKDTILQVAVSYGNEERVERIVDYVPLLLTTKNSKGDGVLHIAARAGRVSMLQTLIFLYAKYDMDYVSYLREQNEEKNTPLHESLIHLHQDAAVFLIAEDIEGQIEPNKDGEMPLYLAAKAGYKDCVKMMLDKSVDNENPDGIFQGKSSVHAAILARNIEILHLILDNRVELINSTDEAERTPLHCAASIGYLNGINYLLRRNDINVVTRDKYGFFPIHLAAIEGHAEATKSLLKTFPHLMLLRDRKGRNVLHLAAERGKLAMVNFILQTPELEDLINCKDFEGNTPLHLASKKLFPKIVSTLTWDKRVKINLVNNKGFTPLDAALETPEKSQTSFRKQLTWAALKAAGAIQSPLRSERLTFDDQQPEAQDDNTDNENDLINKKQLKNKDGYKDSVDTLLVVSTLITTVTFAAGFTMPGGSNNSDGTATLVRHKWFCVFIICNTIAMYSSIAATIGLVWSYLDNIHLRVIALKLAFPLLAIALTALSLAFMAGVFLVLHTLAWLATVILVMSLVFTGGFLALFIFLTLRIDSNYTVMRYITYPFFWIMIKIDEWY